MGCRQDCPHTPSRQSGFSLIELMIAVVVVSLLASIAYPSYTSYIQRARRSDGVALLMDVAARQERFFGDNNSYTTTLTALGFASATPLSAQSFYQASVAAGATTSIATSYVITATAVSTDSTCGNLTLDSRGTKGISVSTDATVIAQCWR